MTNRRALELIAIERMCVKKGSGMEYDLNLDKYVQVNQECDRDCANCVLCQDARELMEMYDFVLQKMIDETKKEDRNDDWRDWQRNCDPHQVMAI